MIGVKDWLSANIVLLLSVLPALLAALLVVQTVRLDGFQIDAPLVGKFGPEGWIAKADRLEAEKLAILAAQQEAEEAHLAEIARKEREYQQQAQETDRVREKLESAQLALARRFIAAGGVRPRETGSGAVPPAPRPEGGGTGDSDSAGGVPVVDGLQLVTVYARDVEVCTINTSRLIAAKQWGEGLTE